MAVLPGLRHELHHDRRHLARPPRSLSAPPVRKPAADAYQSGLDRVGALDKKAFAWVFGEETPRETDREVWESNTSQAIDNLHDGIDEFENRLNRELTS
jgi:hypothetical protein